jgi:hypothetical protein
MTGASSSVNPLFDSEAPDRSLLFSYEPEPATPPGENTQVYIERLQTRIQKKWQNVIVIDGPTGVGKSMAGIELATGVQPDWDVDQAAYCADDAMRLWRELGKSDVLLYDEAVLGLLSQGGRRNEELEKLVQALSIIRAKGITTIVCLPSIWMLDSFVREGLAEFWINIYRRGRGRPHRSWERARYKRPNRLPYDRIDELTPLGFRNLDGTKIHRRYEPRKLARIDEFLEDKGKDPSGKTQTCKKCGLRTNSYNLATHKCHPGSEGE